MKNPAKRTVFHFLSEKWAIDDLKKRRLKISLLGNVNDPDELRVATLAGFPMDVVTLLRKSFEEIFGIACFSESWDIPEMWANYADNHCGICLGLQIEQQKLSKVRYLPTEEKLQIPKDLYEQLSQAAVTTRKTTPYLERKFHPYLIRVFTTKLTSWEHEREWRAFPRLEIAENGLYFADFKSSGVTLASVILGAGFKSPVCEIRKLVSAYRGNVPLMRVAERNDGRRLVLT